MQKKVEGIFLTELTLFKFIFNIFFLKKKYCVLSVYSYIFNHGSYLQIIVDSLRQKNISKPLQIEQMKYLILTLLTVKDCLMFLQFLKFG